MQSSIVVCRARFSCTAANLSGHVRTYSWHIYVYGSGLHPCISWCKLNQNAMWHVRPNYTVYTGMHLITNQNACTRYVFALYNLCSMLQDNSEIGPKSHGQSLRMTQVIIDNLHRTPVMVHTNAYLATDSAVTNLLAISQHIIFKLGMHYCVNTTVLSEWRVGNLTFYTMTNSACHLSTSLLTETS